MTKLFLFLVLAFTLDHDCQSISKRSNPSTNSTKVAEGGIQKKVCDFSDITSLRQRGGHNSQLISMPRPDYPSEARERGIKGRVSVLVLVNVHTGLVEQACIKDGDAALADSAKEAALKAKFAPYSSYIQKKFSHSQEILVYNFKPR